MPMLEKQDQVMKKNTDDEGLETWTVFDAVTGKPRARGLAASAAAEMILAVEGREYEVRGEVLYISERGRDAPDGPGRIVNTGLSSDNRDAAIRWEEIGVKFCRRQWLHFGLKAMPDEQYDRSLVEREREDGETRGFMALHVLRFPSGTWGYAGDVPKELGIEVAADKEAVMGGRAYRGDDGEPKMRKFPSFKTMGMAVSHARRLGHEPRVTDADRKVAEEQGTTAYLVPVRLEVPTGRGKRKPGFEWVDGYQLVTPAGEELVPYMRKNEAKQECRDCGWTAEVVGSIEEARAKIAKAARKEPSDIGRRVRIDAVSDPRDACFVGCYGTLERVPDYDTCFTYVVYHQQLNKRINVESITLGARNKDDPVRMTVRGHAYDVTGYIEKADRSVGIMSDSFNPDNARAVNPASPEFPWDSLTDEEVEEIDRAFWAVQPPEPFDPIDEEEEADRGVKR